MKWQSWARVVREAAGDAMGTREQVQALGAYRQEVVRRARGCPASKHGSVCS